MQFKNSSLKKLVKRLSDNDFKYLTEEFGSENLELLKQKDAYPYEYMDSFKIFCEEKLPDEECLYRSVKDGTTGNNGKKFDGHISDEDYLTCKKSWNEFNMKNKGDYHDHYLKKTFCYYRMFLKSLFDMCSNFYGLDPCHYFSSPRLSWDAMLKITGVKLEKIVDIDMYLFIEKGLRGGISYIAKRYSKANNKHINNDDPTKPSIDISYLDINNFYSWAMSSDLPYRGFKWLKSVDGLA